MQRYPAPVWSPRARLRRTFRAQPRVARAADAILLPRDWILCAGPIPRLLAGPRRAGDQWLSLTDPRREVLDHGKEYLVEYFERVRMELPAKDSPPFDVLLGQFGGRFRRPHRSGRKPRCPVAAPAVAQAGAVSICRDWSQPQQSFPAYWQANVVSLSSGTHSRKSSRISRTLRFDHPGPVFRARPLRIPPQNADTSRVEAQLGQFGRTILPRQPSWRQYHRPFRCALSR